MRTRTDLSLAEARRIALAAQGFDRPRPAGKIDARHLRRTIRQLGLLQIDYVNVLLPAQYQVPFSRLGPYEMSRLDDLIYRRGEFTEQWAHEASIVPVESWPLLRHRREARDHRSRWLDKMTKRHPGYIDHVLDEVRANGPLRASDLAEPEGARRRAGAWWGWKQSRTSLEWHFARGAVAVTDRLPNFSRMYDLAERVIPHEHFGGSPAKDEQQRQLLLQGARAHGVGTAADLGDYFRMPIREARQRLSELVESEALREVRVEGWNEAAYMHPDARLPRRIDAAALLSPFDPVVWYRPRALRLFEFEYRIEIYVPKPKRRWGYYVLPFLMGDRLVARVDLKADRKDRRLLVLASYAEPGAPKTKVAATLAKELRTMASWLGLEGVSASRKGDLARDLNRVLKA